VDQITFTLHVTQYNENCVVRHRNLTFR